MKHSLNQAQTPKNEPAVCISKNTHSVTSPSGSGLYFCLKRNIFFSLITILFLTLFVSCERDNYTEWKRLNEQWFEEHKNDSGFVASPSGLRYKIIEEGYQRRPDPTSVLIVDYTISYIDGTTFSTVSSGYAYMSSSIAGFTEGLQKIKTGGRIILYIPYQLAYGEEGSSPIPPYSTLIYDVTLLNSY